MQKAWTEASQRASTVSKTICHTVGCARDIYYDGQCSDHYERPPGPRTCRHRNRAFITCGCCKRVTCEECYGPWNALACVKCRDAA